MTVFKQHDLEEVCSHRWDVLVVGAGPAGAMAARQLAVRGLATLLVDAKPFPRPKVCGGCLNNRALSVLDSAGLGRMMATLPTASLHSFQVRAGGHRLNIKLPRGMAVDRSEFDSALAATAVDAGATFASGVTARLSDFPEDRNDGFRRVHLEDRTSRQSAEARIVVVADGLAGSSTRGICGFESRVADRSYLGIGAQLAAGVPGVDRFARGVIHMAVDRDGYVGMVRMANGGMTVAAAVSPSLMRQRSSPGHALLEVVDRSGMTAPEDLCTAAYQGTPLLTRSARRLAGYRVFLAGDAAGYIEPFTGEGMAWALIAGEMISPFVERSVCCWTPAAAKSWERSYHAAILRRQWLCRGIAALLRRPRLVKGAAYLVERFPRFGERIASRLSAPAAIVWKENS